MQNYSEQVSRAVESSENTEYATEANPNGEMGFSFDSERVTGEETIRVEGEEIKLRVEEVPIDELQLDSENPRIYSGKITAEFDGESFQNGDIEKYIIENSGVSELADDIINNGGLVNPIYTDSDYVVVEGNRRLVALRMIKRRLENGEVSDSELVEYLNNIPVRIFPSDTTEQQISVFLGREHITGKRDWGSFEKAKFIYDLYQEKGTYKKVAEDIGYSQGTVGSYVRSYELAMEYIETYGKDENFVFDHFHSAISYKNQLEKAIDVSTEWGREEFCSWVYNGYFHSTYDVRKIPKVFENDETTKLWNNGKTREAIESLPDVHPVEYGEPFKSLSQARDELKLMDEEDKEKLSEENFREIAEDVKNMLSEHL